MNILILGSGGREQALAWKAAQSERVEQVYLAPGNPGSEQMAKVSNLNMALTDFEQLAQFAHDNTIELTIVGPEQPLVEGIVDYFEAQNLAIFGPSKAAAQLEGSKQFAKDFLARHNIPTAAYEVFTDTKLATDYIQKIGAPIVVKADGLAAGKGVIVAQTNEEAITAVHDMLSENRFGSAGSRVVIEEFLTGEEASFIVMVDGETVLPMATSQDHKALLNGDSGPNTGGMGAYSPAPVVTPSIYEKALSDVIYPTVKGMADEGRYFRGFLYAGLMISPNGDLKVLEYNVRFGDPETQPIMMRLKSDLVEHCLAACHGTLANETAIWTDEHALGVVLAAKGYPESPQKGDVIHGLDKQTDHVSVFHAGTAQSGNNVVTSGGRVLCVTALGNSLSEAQKRAYKAVDNISWNGCYYRTDIGFKAL